MQAANNAPKPGLFKSTDIPWSNDFKSQAQAILDEALILQADGYKSVGITYSANNDQVADQINPALAGPTPWDPKITGGGQAAVMVELQKLLNSDPKYTGLQGVFRILPITTCSKMGGVGKVQDDWLERDLGRINQFANDGGAVIGWKNSRDPIDPNRFAIGGVNSAQLTLAQQTRIQSSLTGFSQQYNPAAVAAPVAPVAPAPANPAAVAEQAARDQLDAGNKAIEAQKHDSDKLTDEMKDARKLFREKNRLAGLDIKFENLLVAGLAPIDPDAGFLTTDVGENKAEVIDKIELGYIKSTGKDNKSCPIVFKSRDEKTNEISYKTCTNPNKILTESNKVGFSNVQNLRRMAQDDGLTVVTLRYPAERDVNVDVALKFVLDSKFGNPKLFDHLGNPKGGVEPGLGETTCGVRLNESIHKFIQSHINDKNLLTGKPTWEAQKCMALLRHEYKDLKLKKDNVADSTITPAKAEARVVEPIVNDVPGGGGLLDVAKMNINQNEELTQLALGTGPNGKKSEEKPVIKAASVDMDAIKREAKNREDLLAAAGKSAKGLGDLLSAAADSKPPTTPPLQVVLGSAKPVNAKGVSGGFDEAAKDLTDQLIALKETLEKDAAADAPPNPDSPKQDDVEEFRAEMGEQAAKSTEEEQLENLETIIAGTDNSGLKGELVAMVDHYKESRKGSSKEDCMKEFKGKFEKLKEKEADKPDNTKATKFLAEKVQQQAIALEKAEPKPEQSNALKPGHH